MVFLENCPPEVIEAIVQLLDQASHLNLRLCSRVLSTNAAQGTFKSYYRTRCVPVTMAGLEDFAQFCASSFVASCLQKLVLVGQVAETRAVDRILQEKTRYVDTFTPEGWPSAKTAKACSAEDLERMQRRFSHLEAIREERRAARSNGVHMDLLVTAFQLLRELGKLSSLHLDVEVIGEDEQTRSTAREAGEWREIWEVASHTWNTAIVSLVRSRLAVEELNVFYDTARCSLDCEELRVDAVHVADLERRLSAVKAVAMSLSEPVLPKKKSQLSGKVTVSRTSNRKFTGVSTVFRALTAVEQLKLRWYRLVQGDPRRRHPAGDAVVLDRVFRAVNTRSLAHLELRGFHVPDAAMLLAFLQTTRPARLSLVRVHSLSGDFGSILDHVTSDLSGVEQLYLEEISDHHQEGPFCFADGEPWPYPRILLERPEEPVPGFAVQRIGPNVRKPIRHSFPYARHIDSPAYRAFRVDREREYGPPDGRFQPRVH